MDNTTIKQKYSSGKPLDAWLEWKELCALNLCNQEFKKILGDAALWSFNKICKTITYDDSYNLSNQYSSSIESKNGATAEHITIFYEAFARLESYSIDTHTQQATKSHKDWLFEQIALSDDPPLKIINGLVLSVNNRCSMMNQVVKQYLLKECGLKQRKNDEGKVRLVNLAFDIDEVNDDGQTIFERLGTIDFNGINLYDRDGGFSKIYSAIDQEAIETIKKSAQHLADICEPQMDIKMRMALIVYLFKLTRSKKELYDDVFGYKSNSGFNYIFETKLPDFIKKELVDNLQLHGNELLTGINFSQEYSEREELRIFTRSFIYELKNMAFNRIKREANSEISYKNLLNYIRETSTILPSL